jgi:hypothetical protein
MTRDEIERIDWISELKSDEGLGELPTLQEPAGTPAEIEYVDWIAELKSAPEPTKPTAPPPVPKPGEFTTGAMTRYGMALMQGLPTPEPETITEMDPLIGKAVRAKEQYLGKAWDISTAQIKKLRSIHHEIAGKALAGHPEIEKSPLLSMWMSPIHDPGALGRKWVEEAPTLYEEAVAELKDLPREPGSYFRITKENWHRKVMDPAMWEHAFKTAMPSLLNTAKYGLMIPVVGSLAEGMGIEGAEAVSEYREWMKSNGQDPDPNMESKLYYAVGFVSGSLEFTPFGLALKRVPGGKKLFTRMMVFSMSEGFTETTQDGFKKLAALTGYGKPADWMELVASFMGGASTGWIGGLIPGTGNRPPLELDDKPSDIQPYVPPSREIARTLREFGGEKVRPAHRPIFGPRRVPRGMEAVGPAEVTPRDRVVAAEEEIIPGVPEKIIPKPKKQPKLPPKVEPKVEFVEGKPEPAEIAKDIPTNFKTEAEAVKWGKKAAKGKIPRVRTDLVEGGLESKIEEVKAEAERLLEEDDTAGAIKATTQRQRLEDALRAVRETLEPIVAEEETEYQRLLREIEQLPVFADPPKHTEERRRTEAFLEEVDNEILAEDAIAAEETVEEAGTKFRQTKDITKFRTEWFRTPEGMRSLEENAETKVQYLLNEANRYLDGEDVLGTPEEPLNIETIRKWASNLASQSEEMRSTVLLDLDFDALKNNVQDAAKWIRETNRPGEKTAAQSIGDPDGVKLYSGLPIGDMARAFQNLLDKTDKAIRGTREENTKEWLKTVKRHFIDDQGNVKNTIEKNYGQRGYEINNNIALARGGGARGARKFGQASKEVYGGLPRRHKKLLDSVIYARRVMQIDRYRKGIKWAKDSKGKSIDGRYAASWMTQLRRSHGEAVYNDLVKRSTSYFDVAREQLKDLMDNGLITRELYDKLVRFDYVRRQLIKRIDPEISFGPHPRYMRVYHSGVDYLSVGKEEDVLETNSELLLAELINRTQGRIAKNNATKHLVSIIEADPDSPIVRLENPGDWVPIPLYTAGERTKLYMPEHLSREWVLADSQITYNLAQALRIISGGVVLRPMATGLNFAFAISQLPMDIAHIWFTSHAMIDGKWKSTYNPVTYPVRMGKDLSTVFPDAITRSGRYLAAIEDGMGMEFLVHQGSFLKRRLGKNQPMEPLLNILGWLTETTEIMTRLALRERALKVIAQRENIKLEEANASKRWRAEASAIARTYLDFGQGGSYTKAADNAVPYLNAGVQATRGIYQAFSRNPKEAALKVALLSIPVSTLFWLGKTVAPKARKDVPDNDKENYFIIHIPDDMARFEDRGQERYFYFKVRKDPGQKFFSALYENIWSGLADDDFDPEMVVKSLTELSPVSAPPVPPTAMSWINYYYNVNFWREDIWKGMHVHPWAEFRKGITPEYAVRLGEVTKPLNRYSISPERVNEALGSLFTRSNPLVGAAGWMYNRTLSELPEDQRRQHLAMSMLRTPVLGQVMKRFVGVTRPGERYRDTFEEAELDVGTRRHINSQEVDWRVDQYFGGNMERRDVFKYVKTVKDPIERDSLFDRATEQLKTREMPNRWLWLRLLRSPPKVRAKVWIEEVEALSSEERKKLLAEGRPVITEVLTDDFFTELGALR